MTLVSRSPASCRAVAAGVTVADLSSLAGATAVLLAIPASHHSGLPATSLQDKVVVDVSNRVTPRPAGAPSQVLS